MRRLAGTVLAAWLAAEGAALAQDAPVTGVGPYQLGMSPDAVRAAVPEGRFFERWLDERWDNAGTMTMGPPHFIGDLNFAVILNFEGERRLYKIELVHFDWVRTRQECRARHEDVLRGFAARHGPFSAAPALPGMQRVIDGVVFNVYINIAPEDARDTVLAPQTEALADGGVMQIYRATAPERDLRHVENSQAGAEQVFVTDFVSSDGSRAIYLQSSVRPLDADDEPRGAYRYNCSTRIVIHNPTLDPALR